MQGPYARRGGVHGREVGRHTLDMERRAGDVVVALGDEALVPSVGSVAADHLKLAAPHAPDGIAGRDDQDRPTVIPGFRVRGTVVTGKLCLGEELGHTKAHGVFLSSPTRVTFA